MADYHIYIHSDSRNGDNHTKPFSSDKESAFKPTNISTEGLEESATETGAASLSKTSAGIAVAVAAIKVLDSVLTTGFSHLTEYTGHYEYEMGYNNWKTFVRHVTHPVDYLKQAFHRNAQYNKENIRIQEEAKLIGKTIYSDWKIGV